MKTLITAEFHQDGIKVLEKYTEVQYENWRDTNKIFVTVQPPEEK